MSTVLQDRLLAAMLSSLSIVVSFGLAFWWNLEKPFWAGFTAMVISLSTIGQTAQKALLRIAGTVAGAVAGLSLLALADQQHWVVLTLLFIHIAIMLAFMLTSRYHSYFFYTAAIVAAIIVIGSIHNPLSPFSFAVARIEETVLGIVVYSVLALLVWTRSSVDALHKNCLQLVSIHQKIFQAHTEFLQNGEKSFIPDLYTQGMHCIKSCQNLLPAARMESYVVRKNHQYWTALLHYSHNLLQIQNIFANLLRQMPAATLHALFPPLEAQLAALAVACDPSASQKETASENEETLRIDQTALRALPILDQHTARHLQHEYARQTECAAFLRRYLHVVTGENVSPPAVPAQPAEPPQDFFTRRQATQFFKGAFIYWSTILIWIYVNPPGTVQTSFAEMGLLVGLVGFLAGNLAPIQVLGSFFSGCLLAFGLYFGVMPWLHSFAELGIILFCLLFLVTFRYYLPAHGLIRTGLLMPAFAMTGLNDARHFAPEPFFSGALSLLSCATLVALIYYLFTGTPPARRFFLQQKRCLDGIARQLALMTRSPLRPWWLRPLDVWRLREIHDLGQSLLELSYDLGATTDDIPTRNLRLAALNTSILSQYIYAMDHSAPAARRVLQRLPSPLLSPWINDDMDARIRHLRRFSHELEACMGLREPSPDAPPPSPDEDNAATPHWRKELLSLCSVLRNTVASAEKIPWEELNVRKF